MTPAVGWAVGKKKTDFVGNQRSQTCLILSPKVVANWLVCRTKNPKVVLEEGAQIVLDPNQPIPMKMIGFVTSSYWSDTLGHSIAMALVEDGFNLKGETLHVPMPDETIAVEVCDPIFYDKEGARLNV